LALALAGALSFSAAMATTLPKMELADIAKAAQVAVVAKVTSASTIETSDGAATMIRLEVEQGIWGADQGATLEVLTPGGTIQRGRYKITDGPADLALPILDQRSVYMLQFDSKSGKYLVVGGNQGQLQIAKNQQGVDSVLLPGALLMPIESAMGAIKDARLAPSDGLAR
jgi:hypothetical protein